MEKASKPENVVSDAVSELPVLPLRDVVVYPHMVIPLFVGREKSVRALESAMEGEKRILLVAQRSPAVKNESRRSGIRRNSGARAFTRTLRAIACRDRSDTARPGR